MLRVLVLMLGTKIFFPVRTRQEDFILKLNFPHYKNSPGENQDDEDTDRGCEDDLCLGVQSPITRTISRPLIGIRELSSISTNQRPEWDILLANQRQVWDLANERPVWWPASLPLCHLSDTWPPPCHPRGLCCHPGSENTLDGHGD